MEKRRTHCDEMPSPKAVPDAVCCVRKQVDASALSCVLLVAMYDEGVKERRAKGTEGRQKAIRHVLFSRAVCVRSESQTRR